MIQDLGHACRTIARMPIVAAVIVCSLAVGIGVNTVVYSWMEAVVFRPIPGVADSGQFHLLEPRREAGMYPGSSWPEYRDLSARLRLMPSLIAFRMASLYVGEPGQVDRGNGLLVSGNYFQALGLRPAAGRLLGPEDAATAGGTTVVVISYDYWQTHFAGAVDVPGRTMRVNGQHLTIVGVAPRGFEGTLMRLSFDLWLPATLAPVVFNGSPELEDRAARDYSIIGRGAPPVTRAQAQAEVDAAMSDLARDYPKTNGGLGAEVLPFGRAPRGPQRLLATSLA